MNRAWTVGLLSTALTALSPIAAHAASFSYAVPLEASQEVAPNISTSSARSSATGTLDGDPLNWVFRYTVQYAGLEGPLADGHIHLGARGTNGPVVHLLDNIGQFLGTTSGTIVGDWTSSDVTAIGRVTPDVVFNNFLAGNYYFNLHSSQFPGGEVRGQIDPLVSGAEAVPEPATMLGLLTAGVLGAAARRQRQS